MIYLGLLTEIEVFARFNMSSRSKYLNMCTILTVAFFLGTYLIENIGIQYVSSGGNPLFKLHLYSYLIMLVFFISCLRYGTFNFFNKMDALKSHWILSLMAISICMIYTLIRFGTSGAAYQIVTIFTPILIIPYLFYLGEKDKVKILELLSWLLFINSCVALIEIAMKQTVIPVEFTILSYFRSTAFLANPLNNALITASLAPVLIRYTKVPAGIYFLITSLSLFAYGGRTALAVFLITSLLISIIGLRKFLTTGLVISKINLAIKQVQFLFINVILLYIITTTTIAERISNKLFVDDSAQARFDIFLLFEQLSFKEWIFGANASLIDNISFYLGIDIVENYFVSWILSLGLIGATLLFFSIYNLLLYFFRAGDLYSKVLIFNFSVVAFSNNALSSKTAVLLFVYVVLVCHSSRLSANKNRLVCK